MVFSIGKGAPSLSRFDSKQGLDSIQTPLLAGLQRSDEESPRVSGSTLNASMSSASATQNLSEMQYCPEFKLAETLVKLREEPKFLAFYSRVDKSHFNQKLGDFLSGVDKFQAKITVTIPNEVPLNFLEKKAHNFTLRDVNTDQEFFYTASCFKKGVYEYIPELKRIDLTDGKESFPGNFGNTNYSFTKEGKFSCIPELKRTDLTDGKVTLSDGKIEEGKRAYIPELKNMVLTDGKVTFPDGQVMRIF